MSSEFKQSGNWLFGDYFVTNDLAYYLFSNNLTEETLIISDSCEAKNFK